MRVGIITVYDSQNVGSFLQAFALQEFVRANGDEPYMIQTRSEKAARSIFLGCDKDTIKKNPRVLLRFLRNYFFRHSQITQRRLKFERYKKDWEKLNIITVKEANELGLDLVLIGSDEIWNVNVPAFEKDIMYGGGISAGRKAAYAISSGDAAPGDFDGHKNLIEHISELDSIFARDDKTAGLLDEFGINVSGRVYDPTLQVKLTDLLNEDSGSGNESYFLVYSYNVPDGIRERIQSFARENNLTVAAVSLYHSWCDKYINCSPLEIGSLFRKAKYVYTSTFHGTILSLLFHTQVLISGEKPKVVDLLDKLDMRDALIDNACTPEQFAARINRDIDYEAMEKKLEDIRESSVKVYENLKDNNHG